MRIVIAIGGNALLQRGEALTWATQKSNAANACRAIAELIKENQIILTHGNGPQVGLLSLQSTYYSPSSSEPMDALVAESQGMLGYLLTQEMTDQISAKVAAILTRVEVDPNDAEFYRPSKFIGPVYSSIQATELTKKNGWEMAYDGKYYRRVVPSPLPQSIIEIDIIRTLVDNDIVPICLGGGGIPVICQSDKKYEGIEAVIDKDLSSALLAEKINADRLMILTDVPAVMTNWRKEDQSPIGTIKASDLRKLDFPRGSMGPKVAAACNFVENTKQLAYIGALADSLLLLKGEAGTTIVSA